MISSQNEIADFIQPRLLGPLVDPESYFERGIACYGLAVDAAGIMVAGIFGGRQVVMDRFYPEVDLGLPACVEIADERVEFRLAGGDAYKQYSDTCPDHTGTFPLFILKEALADRPLARLGEQAHFYTLGRIHDSQPCLEVWATRMQDLNALPLDPDWYPQLWELLLTEGWATSVSVYGGFGPIWDVFIGRQDWQNLVLQRIKIGELV
ncbi:MAG: hypothetical protein JXB38_02600 [Anaerolineales bacterium]|nr:hypothetical protein [Anaerolineales bacterium]